MKIAVLLGRGVEGVGVTKNVVELQKLYSNVLVFATVDKVWQRRNSMPLVVTNFIGADWDTHSKPKNSSIKCCTEVIDAINSCDVCLVFSMPSTTHNVECSDNFLRMLKLIKIRKCAVQVDHHKNSINRNANFIDVMKQMNVILTHSMQNACVDVLKKEGVHYDIPVDTMGVGVNFTKDNWVSIEEQNPKLVRWVGRATLWKGPHTMIDFHNSHLRKHGFTTCLEGLEASSLGWQDILYFNRDISNRRNCVNQFRGEANYPNKYSEAEQHYHQDVGECYLYPKFVHSTMIGRMAKSAFGSDLMNFKKNIYGNNIEYCHSDSWIGGVVPIFHKHFGDNVIHRVTGNPVINDDNGTLFFDNSSADKVTEQMLMLANDNVMRDEWRHKSYEYWSKHSDAKTVYDDILYKALHLNAKPSLFTFE